MASTNNQELSLKASYSSPTNEPFTLSHSLPAPPSGTTNPTVPDKTAYLAKLRQSVGTLQEQINKELTQRMEEDKTKAADEAIKNGKAAAAAAAVDEAKEEENYGEEMQEEED